MRSLEKACLNSWQMFVHVRTFFNMMTMIVLTMIVTAIISGQKLKNKGTAMTYIICSYIIM